MTRVRPRPHRTGRWYVDPAAGGSATGASWTNAWTDFASIVWSSIQPGDTIYLSGGATSQTYTTKLTIGKSGTAGSSITVTAGTDAGHNGTVILDGATSTTQDSTDGIIDTAGFTNLVIQNLTVQNTLEAGIRVATVTSGSIIVQNCTVHTGTAIVTATTNATTAAGNAVLHFAATPANILAHAADAFAVKNATHTTVLPAPVYTVSATSTTVTLGANATGAGVASGDTIQFGFNAWGILVTGVSGTAVVTVRNNTIDTPASTIAETDGVHTTANAAGSVIVENNTITINNSDPAGFSEGIQSLSDFNTVIRGNAISHPNGGVNNRSILISNVAVSGTVTAYNNTVARGVSDEACVAHVNTDVLATGVAKFWNNTIYGGSIGLLLDHAQAATEAKNNLIYVPDAKTGLQQVWTGGSFTTAALASANIDYNAYLGTGAAITFASSGGTAYATFATWQATGYEAHGVGAGAAGFTNAGAGDFHIAATSAAAGKGVAIATVTVDKDGKARSAAGYDIGAYDVVGVVPAAITGLQALSVTVTTIAVGFNLPVIDQGGVQVRYELVASPGFVNGPTAATITPGLGSITDGSGNVWAVTSAGSISRNGTVDPATFNVLSMWIVNGVVWQQTGFGTWFSWLGTTWSAATSATPFQNTGIIITGLTAGTAYNVRVFPFNLSGNGPNAAPISVTTASASGLPGDTSGTQANRIADLCERMGFNVYSSLTDDGSNIMGSFPANYSIGSVTNAYKFFTGTTAMVLWTRIWVASQSWETVQDTWAPQLFLATGSNISLEASGDLTVIAPLAAASHNGTGNSAGAQGWLKISEGFNEPNGIGGETGTETVAGDQYRAATFAGYTEIQLSTASLVIGIPAPEGYLVGYATPTQIANMVASTTITNIHYYPSQNPDFDDAGSPLHNGEMNDIVRGMNTYFGVTRTQMISEWHPTLSHKGNPNVNNGRWDDIHDPYFAFIYLMSGYRVGWITMLWYALYDFGTRYTTGMWHTDARKETPRAEAYLVRAMFQLLGEFSLANKLTFNTSKLNYTISGLPGPAAGTAPNSGGQHMLFQNSDGRFGLFIWNSQQAPGGVGVPVTVNFPSHPVWRLIHYDLTTNAATNMTPLATQAGPVASFTFTLTASAHLLLIDYSDPNATLPSAPLSPSISSITTTSMVLTVLPPTTVGSGTLTYTWQISPAGANTWTTAGSGATATSFTYTGLTANISYDLRAFATNSSGAGPTSQVVTGSTPSTLPGDLTGTVALRIADMMEMFGVNCFPNGQGGSAAGASIAQHLVGLSYICGGSGMGMFNRIYANSTALDVPFMTQISQALPGTRWSSCINFASSSVAVVQAEATTQSITSTGILAVVEGYNEPDNGGPNQNGLPIPVAQCLQGQQLIYGSAHPNGVEVALPSVTDSGQPTYESNYFGATTSTNWQSFMANSDYSNGHDYPNSGSFNADAARRSDLLVTQTGKPAMITEYHPLLFNNAASKAAGEAYAAYQILIATLSGYIDHHLIALQWWEMYDYTGFSPAVGLFRGADPNNPTPAATAIRSMYQLTTDLGATKRTFNPTRLNFSHTALPAAAGFSTLSGGRNALFQNSSGQFFLFVWNEQATMGGAGVSVTYTFGGTRGRVRRFNLSAAPVASPTPAQDLANVASITFTLAAEVHLLVIDYAPTGPALDLTSADNSQYIPLL